MVCVTEVIVVGSVLGEAIDGQSVIRQLLGFLHSHTQHAQMRARRHQLSLLHAINKTSTYKGVAPLALSATRSRI